MIIAGIAILYSAIFFGPLAFFFHDHNTTTKEEITHKKELLALIPKDAKVLVSDTPLSLVSTRRDVFLLRYGMIGKTQYQLSDFSFPKDIDFILLDTNDMILYDAQYQEHPLYKDAYSSGAARLRVQKSRDD